jgi:transposase-like protein
MGTENGRRLASAPKCPHCDCRDSVEIIGNRYACSGCGKSWPIQSKTDVNGNGMFDP